MLTGLETVGPRVDTMNRTGERHNRHAASKTSKCDPFRLVALRDRRKVLKSLV
jgi:hypothetical protein